MNSFPPSRRLVKPQQFKYVWDGGKKLSVPFFAVMRRENDCAHPRLGISISKRNVRNAVDRNRIKRLARETFRLRQLELNAFDVIVVAYKGADSLPPEQQYQSLQALWDRLSAKCKK